MDFSRRCRIIILTTKNKVTENFQDMDNTQFNGLEEMANFTFTTKYAKYDEKKQRRETWDETVSRVEKMHLKKFNFLSDKDKAQIVKAFDFVRAKRITPSMRSMQFGGKAVEAIARQPEAISKIQTNMIIAAALVEGVALFAVVVALL